MNKCLQCGKEYEPIRATSKFCSTNCRIKYNRLTVSKNDNLTVSMPKKVTVSYNSEIHERQLTKNEKAGITEYRKCHNCGEKVSHLICLCNKCVIAGVTHQSLQIDIKKCE